MQHQLILVSAGESEWLPLNLFTGWSDVLLSERGMEQARTAGHLLKKEGILLDRAYTSYLRRGIRTLSLILQELHEEYIPVTKAWQLNERHYGALQELSKIDTARSYGDDRVADWRRTYDVKPPEVDADDDRNPANDVMYRKVDKRLLPVTESLQDVERRVWGYYESEIAPKVQSGETVLVAGHSSSIRALLQHFDGIPDEKAPGLEIPPAVPFVYTLDEEGRALDKKILHT